MLHKLFPFLVHRRYLTTGADFGDAVSYIYMGECIGFGRMLKQWAKWERRYADLGYRTISLDRFVAFGGYGKSLEDVLKVKREKGETPVFHAELIAERRKENGSAERHSAITAILNGAESAAGTYDLPSTEEN